MTNEAAEPKDSIHAIVEDIKSGACTSHDEIRRRIGIVNNEIRSGIVDINSIRRNLKHSNETMGEISEAMEYLFEEADEILEKIGAPMP